MRLMNNMVTMLGTMANDVTYRKNQNGDVHAAQFAIYVFRKNKKEGDKDDLFECVIFGKDAQNWASGNAKNVPKKGDEVYVTGPMHNGRDYVDRNGVKREGKNSIWCDDVRVTRTKEERQFGKNNGNTDVPVKEFTRQTVPVTPAPAPQNQDFMEIPEGLEDEIPFI